MLNRWLECFSACLTVALAQASCNPPSTFRQGHEITNEGWLRLFNVNGMSGVRLSQGGAF